MTHGEHQPRHRLLLSAVAATAFSAVTACGGGSPDTAPTGTPPSYQGPSSPASASPPAGGAGPSTSTAPGETAPTASYVVRGGKLVSGPREVTVRTGTTVVIEVASDADDEIHLHGYDRQLDVKAGVPARMTFGANIPGIFEVELHSGVKLCDLRVT